MIARRRGRVLNVASTAGFQPGPLMAVYYASKAYVLSFSEAIANELEGSGVTVTCLCPGPTRSEFQNRAQMSNSKLFENSLMSAAQVAQQGYRATMSGQTLVIPGHSNLVWAFFTRFLSRRQVPRMVRRVQDTKIASTETSGASSTRTMQEDSNQESDASTTGEQ
jgi:short-subunit dehydrogenase